MTLAAKLDDFGKPAWIALIVLGFMAWWPVGLMALAFTIGSGRMGCGHHSYGPWHGGADRWQSKMERMRERMNSGGFWGQPSSGNRAFDEYRADTFRRLEEEQREFRDFLGRLR